MFNVSPLLLYVMSLVCLVRLALPGGGMILAPVFYAVSKGVVKVPPRLPQQPRVVLSFSSPVDLAQRLDALAEQLGLSRSKVLRLAIEAFCALERKV